MKNLILTVALMSVSMISAQWKYVNQVDSFGDPTGETVKTIRVRGYFSNSATTRSEARLRIVDFGTHVRVSITEYGGSNPATFTGDFAAVMVKKANGYRVNGFIEAFNYGTKYLDWREKTPKQRKRVERKGGVFMIDMIRGLETGDKLVIINQGSNYYFKITY